MYLFIYSVCVYEHVYVCICMDTHTHTQLKVLFSPLGARSPPVRMSESGEERSRAL